METIPSPGRKPNDGPGNPDYPGDDVREPPLPEERPKEDLPGKDDLIDPTRVAGESKRAERRSLLRRDDGATAG
jgi:hypothetical protein